MSIPVDPVKSNENIILIIILTKRSSGSFSNTSVYTIPCFLMRRFSTGRRTSLILPGRCAFRFFCTFISSVFFFVPNFLLQSERITFFPSTKTNSSISSSEFCCKQIISIQIKGTYCIFLKLCSLGKLHRFLREEIFLM